MEENRGVFTWFSEVEEVRGLSPAEFLGRRLQISQWGDAGTSSSIAPPGAWGTGRHMKENWVLKVMTSFSRSVLACKTFLHERAAALDQDTQMVGTLDRWGDTG